MGIEARLTPRIISQKGPVNNRTRMNNQPQDFIPSDEFIPFPVLTLAFLL
jgi:hypothetical protein